MTQTSERVFIFDTTLRRVERALNRRMTQPEKVRVARALGELGVDVIEAGFPAAAQVEMENVTAVAREVYGPVICGLARCTRRDIELAARALGDAPRRRIRVLLATTDDTIESCNEFIVPRDEILFAAAEGVRIARDFCKDVEFSLEGEARIESGFLVEVIETAIAAGATTVNIPDSVGYMVPDEISELLRYVRRNVRGIEGARLSVQCRDDLGMAVANSLAAVVAGVRQVECAINGIGGRGRNCSLKELVTALKVREAFFNVGTGIDVSRIHPTARLVSAIATMYTQRSQATADETDLSRGWDLNQLDMRGRRS